MCQPDERPTQRVDHQPVDAIDVVALDAIVVVALDVPAPVGHQAVLDGVVEEIATVAPGLDVAKHFSPS